MTSPCSHPSFEKSVSIIVLLLRLCVGSNPSSHMYSNFDLVAISLVRGKVVYSLNV